MNYRTTSICALKKSEEIYAIPPPLECLHTRQVIIFTG